LDNSQLLSFFVLIENGEADATIETIKPFRDKFEIDFGIGKS
jgi:hypothetical protein